MGSLSHTIMTQRSNIKIYRFHITWRTYHIYRDSKQIICHDKNISYEPISQNKSIDHIRPSDAPSKPPGVGLGTLQKRWTFVPHDPSTVLISHRRLRLAKFRTIKFPARQQHPYFWKGLIGMNIWMYTYLLFTCVIGMPYLLWSAHSIIQYIHICIIYIYILKISTYIVYICGY